MGKTAVATWERRGQSRVAVRPVREALASFRERTTSGEHWYIALLATVGTWPLSEEKVGDRHYRYLIAGEAFDWMLLAERILAAVDGAVSHHERDSLLLRGQPPLLLTTREMRALMGEAKYQAHLNFFYGVIVEEALHAAVAEEVRREQFYRRLKEGVVQEEVFQRVYGESLTALLEQFRRATKLRRKTRFTLEDWKTFIYWLFKYRVTHAEKARVASDTKKGLDWLHRQGRGRLPIGGVRLIGNPYEREPVRIS